MPDLNNIPFLRQMVKTPSPWVPARQAKEILNESKTQIYTADQIARFGDALRRSVDREAFTDEEASDYLRTMIRNQTKVWVDLSMGQIIKRGGLTREEADVILEDNKMDMGSLLSRLPPAEYDPFMPFEMRRQEVAKAIAGARAYHALKKKDQSEASMEWADFLTNQMGGERAFRMLFTPEQNRNWDKEINQQVRTLIQASRK